MNPIIYFDELDKVSETFKGQNMNYPPTHTPNRSFTKYTLSG